MGTLSLSLVLLKDCAACFPGRLVSQTLRRKNMGKLSIPALALAIYMGTTAMIATGNRTVASSVSSEATLAVDGAFRDGLYLGKLAAAGGQTLRPPIGRWSTDRD